jgi:hypothetical protein
MAGDEAPSAKVLFRVLDEDGSAEVETLWAHDLGRDRYRLANCPFYAYGVSWQDVVHAPFDPQEGFPTFQRVLEKSGNRTIRIVFDDASVESGKSESLLDGIMALGCDYEGATKTYLSLNIPPDVDLNAVVEFLIRESAEWEHTDPTYDEFHASRQ